MGSAFIIVRGKNKQASQERVHAQEAPQTLISLEKRAWKLPQGRVATCDIQLQNIYPLLH